MAGVWERRIKSEISGHLEEEKGNYAFEVQAVLPLNKQRFPIHLHKGLALKRKSTIKISNLAGCSHM